MPKGVAVNFPHPSRQVETHPPDRSPVKMEILITAKLKVKGFEINSQKYNSEHSF